MSAVSAQPRTRPRVGFLPEPTHGVRHADVYVARLATVTASAIAARTEEAR